MAIGSRRRFQVTHLPPRTRSMPSSVGRIDDSNLSATHYIDAAFCPPSPHLPMSPDSTSYARYLPLPRPRKRQRPEPPEKTGTSQPPPKKQRLNHPSGSQPPSAFWDNLSKLWLTKRALRELGRRNSQTAPSPSRSPHRRDYQVAYCTDYLSRCTPRILKNIRVLARHGGPDLSDLRNVCIARHLLASRLTLLVPRTSTSFRSHNEL